MSTIQNKNLLFINDIKLYDTRSYCNSIILLKVHVRAVTYCTEIVIHEGRMQLDAILIKSARKVEHSQLQITSRKQSQYERVLDLTTFLILYSIERILDFFNNMFYKMSSLISEFRSCLFFNLALTLS